MTLRSTLLTFIPVAALGLLSAGCEKAAAPPAAAERPPAAVTVKQPVQREITEWDEYPARLDAVDTVEVRARVSGYLESVAFKDGAEVKKEIGRASCRER